MNSDIFIFELDYCAKPRETRRDRWNPRKSVKDYRAYADKLRWHWEKFGAEIPLAFHLIFVREMPKSWSKKKRSQLHLSPCRCRPDADNLWKAFWDALFYLREDDDSIIWDGRVTKIWGSANTIVFYPIPPFCAKTFVKQKKIIL